MRKLLIFLSVLFIFGCSSLKPGESFTYDNTKGTAFENGVMLTEDMVSGLKYYSAWSYTDYVLAGKKLTFHLYYYPEDKNYDFSFSGYNRKGGRFLRGVLFTNFNTRVNIEIDKTYKLDSSTSKYLTKMQVIQLKEIFSSNKPITARVYTNEGFHDIVIDSKYNKGILDVLNLNNKKSLN